MGRQAFNPTRWLPVARGAGTFAAWFVFLVAVACTRWNSIDACGGQPPPITMINRLYDGDQFVPHPVALAALPTGHALALFSSSRNAGGVDRTELRATRIDRQGQPVRDCESGIDQERVLAEIGPEDGKSHLRSYGTLAPAEKESQATLVAFYRADGDAPGEIAGQFLTSAGCVGAQDKPFVLTPGRASIRLTMPSAVRLHRTDDLDDFVVVWVSVDGADLNQASRVEGRVLRDVQAGPMFLPTVGAPDGGPMSLDLPDRLIMAVSIVGLPDDRLALIWQSPVRGVVRAMLFDRQLRSIGEATTLFTGEHGPGLSSEGTLAVLGAWDGDRLLVVWVGPDSKDHNRVYGQFLDRQLRLIETPLTHGGQPFQASLGTSETENRISLAAFPAGGFAVGWHEGSKDASSGQTTAAIISRDGHREFVRPSCDQKPFALDRSSRGGSRQSSLAVLNDGTLLGIWTDGGNDGPDRSGTSVRGVAFEHRALFP